MRAFLSKYAFKIDAKGRVSIPAAFRTTLVEFGSTQFLAFESPSARAIHCVTAQLIEQLTAAQNPLAAFGIGDPTSPRRRRPQGGCCPRASDRAPRSRHANAAVP